MLTAVIVTYNMGSNLVLAIFSVLSQTKKFDKIVVYDDGSIDNTEELIKAMNVKNLLYLKGAANNGIAYARNRALEAVDTKFAAFLDADDKWLPAKTEIQLRYMVNRGFKISQTSCFLGEIRNIRPTLPVSGKSIRLLLSAGNVPILQSTMMFEMKAIREFLPYNEEFKAWEDVEFWYRVCSKYDIGYVPVSLSYRNLRTQSITKKEYRLPYREKFNALISKEHDKEV